MTNRYPEAMMQEGEERADLGCGCVLQREEFELVGLYQCSLHQNAEKPLAALSAIVTSLEDDHQSCAWCEDESWYGKGHKDGCLLGEANAAIAAVQQPAGPVGTPSQNVEAWLMQPQ